MYPTYNLKVDSKGKYVYPRLNPSDIEAIRKIYGKNKVPQTKNVHLGSRRKFEMPEVYPPSEKTCESSSQGIKNFMIFITITLYRHKTKTFFKLYQRRIIFFNPCRFQCHLW